MYLKEKYIKIIFHEQNTQVVFAPETTRENQSSKPKSAGCEKLNIKLDSSHNEDDI